MYAVADILKIIKNPLIFVIFVTDKYNVVERETTLTIPMVAI